MLQLNEVMKIIDPVFGLYISLRESVTRGSCCQSASFTDTGEEAMNFTVRQGATPFSSCRALTGVAYNYWIEKQCVKTQDEKR
jgi:hypothetical protein